MGFSSFGISSSPDEGVFIPACAQVTVNAKMHIKLIRKFNFVFILIGIRFIKIHSSILFKLTAKAFSHCCFVLNHRAEAAV
jgi:hypothetical protein